jgi:hypothetical protein
LEQQLAEAQPHQQPNKETMTNDDDWEKEILDSLKRKHGGDWDHPERTTLGTIKNNLLRLKKIIEIHQAAQEEGIVPATMTENCRTFFKEVATPVTNCLQNHLNNNEMAFLGVYTTKW